MPARSAPGSIDDEAPAGTARLAVRVPAPVGRRRAASVLGPARYLWLGDVLEHRDADNAHRPLDRHLVDLELHVGERAPRLAFRKAAYLDVGPLQTPRSGPLRLLISWRAAGLAPLFPVFSGSLEWAAGELRLVGFYAPPGGAIGLLADRLLLNVAARGTARLLLERIAAAMRGDES